MSIGESARALVRDFPRFFEANYSQATSTVRLPHPLIQSITVTEPVAGAEVTAGLYVDFRNGIMKVDDPHVYADGLYVTGYHYTWFLDDDLDFYANMVRDEIMDGRLAEELTDMEANVAAMGTVVYAYYALLAEFSTDIDVSSPEGMMIPAHQRFQQVQQLLGYWQKRYEEYSALTGVGIYKIEQFTLRRIARLTGRYVPLYRGREVDDPVPPTRIFPPIDPIEKTGAEQGSSFDEYGLAGPGWTTIGTSGT